MTEHITKEQARDALLYLDDDLAFVPEDRIEEISNAWNDEIRRLPAADVVEVVRCKDCRHKQVDEIIFALSANPETALFCKRMGGIISETFYCAAGERMDGDKS